MSDGERVKASEPRPVSDADKTEASSPPAAVAAREDDIDAETAGDGVAFFEGGDGREAARDDIERSG